MEDRLSRQRYLAGDRITEADWRALPTLLRFDPVYHGHFKCNLKRLIEYPHINAYARRLHTQHGVGDLFNLEHAKRHYYESHDMINPTAVVPLGPDIHVADGNPA